MDEANEKNQCRVMGRVQDLWWKNANSESPFTSSFLILSFNSSCVTVVQLRTTGIKSPSWGRTWDERKVLASGW